MRWLTRLVRMSLSFWTFFWRERLGYRRPSGLSIDDLILKEQFIDRKDRLVRSLKVLDAARDTYGQNRHEHT